MTDGTDKPRPGVDGSAEPDNRDAASDDENQPRRFRSRMEERLTSWLEERGLEVELVDDPAEGDEWALLASTGTVGLVARAPTDRPGFLIEFNRPLTPQEGEALSEFNPKRFHDLCQRVSRMLLTGPYLATYNLNREAERPGLSFGRHLYLDDLDRQTVMDTVLAVQNRAVLVQNLLANSLDPSPQPPSSDTVSAQQGDTDPGIEVI